MFSRQNKSQCLALNVAKTFNRQALTSYRKSRQVALMKKVCRPPSPHFSTLHCTVVGLSTRPAFLIIFHFFQIQNFMVLQQAFSYKKIHVKQEKWI